MTYSRLLLPAVLVLLAACDSAILDDPMKKAVRETLKDPDSAKFGEKFVIENRACISVNAKNSYGGYTGATNAHLKKLSNDNWYVDTLDGKGCSELVLTRQLVVDKANEDAEKMVLEKLKQKQLILSDVKSVYLIKDQVCAGLAREILTHTRLANDADGQSSTAWQARAGEGLKIIESGSCK